MRKLYFLFIILIAVPAFAGTNFYLNLGPGMGRQYGDPGKSFEQGLGGSAAIGISWAKRIEVELGYHYYAQEPRSDSSRAYVDGAYFHGPQAAVRLFLAELAPGATLYGVGGFAWHSLAWGLKPGTMPTFPHFWRKDDDSIEGTASFLGLAFMGNLSRKLALNFDARYYFQSWRSRTATAQQVDLEGDAFAFDIGLRIYFGD